MSTTASPPTPAERRAQLLEVFADGQVHAVSQLAERFGWSATAVRRDLASDIEGGALERVQGADGAVVGLRRAQKGQESTPTPPKGPIHYAETTAESFAGYRCGAVGGGRYASEVPMVTCAGCLAVLRGNVSTTWTPLEVDLEEIVLDPALQCRRELTQATVDQYAAVLEDGGEFEHRARCIRVDGRLFLVDGWHRHAATRQAFRGSPKLQIEYRDGTRRDAILAAVKANSKHGLPRSGADKRRAVRTLLMDPDWCALSTRQLGELADVSHKHVGDIRREYGVVAGEVLTQARAELIDGEPALAWRELLDGATHWSRASIEAMRVAASPAQLVAAWRNARQYGAATGEKAYKLRQEELATSVWPWADDRTPVDVANRAAGLDTVEDLLVAVAAMGCPRRAALYDLIYGVSDLAKRTDGLEALLVTCKDRPALLALVEARIQAVAGQKAKDPWTLINAIRDARPERQAELLKALPAEYLNMVTGRQLDPTVRDGVYRELIRAAGGDVGACADDVCGGWVRKGDYNVACLKCGQDPERLRNEIRRALKASAVLLGRPGYGVRVSGVVVDRQGAELLGTLAAAAAGGTLSSSEVQRELRAWAARKLPDVVIADVDEDPADEEEAEDDDGTGDDEDPK